MFQNIQNVLPWQGTDERSYSKWSRLVKLTAQKILPVIEREQNKWAIK